jgi:hypothetical protein
VRAYPNVAAVLAEGRPSSTTHTPTLLVPFELRVGDQHLSMFTTLTTFGTPRDVTLDDLAIELFYPADDMTEQFFDQAEMATT